MLTKAFSSATVPTFKGGEGGGGLVFGVGFGFGVDFALSLWLQLKPYSYLKIVVVPVDKWPFSIICLISQLLSLWITCG